MTKTEKHFVPMLLLASGTLGSEADATIISQNFNYQGVYLDITSTGANLVNVRDADTKYHIQSVTSEAWTPSGKKNLPTHFTEYHFQTLIQSDGLSTLYTYFSPVDRIGNANDPYTNKDSSALDMTGTYYGANQGAVSYAQLKFKLDGVTTYGVVGVQAAVIRSIRYEVLDAVAPVPEPAVWAEMIVGLGAAGAVMRRRRTARAIAA